MLKKYNHVEGWLDSSVCFIKALNMYWLSLITFVFENLDMFDTELEVHTVSMRNKHYLSSPVTDLTVYQKLVYCAGIKPCNKLSWNNEYLSATSKQFQVTLKGFLMSYSYSAERFIWIIDWLITVSSLTVCCMYWCMLYIFLYTYVCVCVCVLLYVYIFV